MGDVKQRKLNELLDLYNASVIDSGKCRYILEVPADTSDEKVKQLSEELERLLNVPDNSDSSVLKAIYNLNDSIDKVFNKGSIPRGHLLNMIYSFIYEINYCRTDRRYRSPKVGDIVSVNFGYHMYGELYGSLPCVVLDASKCPAVYVAPIFNGASYINPCRMFEICTYDILQSNSNPLILPPGSHLLSKRINIVSDWRIQFYYGEIRQEQMDLILQFMHFCDSKPISTPDSKAVCGSCISENTDEKKPSIKELLATTLEEPCNKIRRLNPHTSDISKIQVFLDAIDIKANPYVVDAFSTALDMSRHNPNLNLTFKELMLHMRIKYKQDICKELMEDFRTWKKSYPELAEKKSLSFIHLVQLFVSVAKD